MMVLWEEARKLPLFDLCDVVFNKRKYINLPMSFDIETSSYFEKDGIAHSNEDFERALRKNPKAQFQYRKCACVYVWQFSIGLDITYFGRTLEEFVRFLDIIAGKLQGRKAIIYVHNLSYEFQFIYKYFEWEKVFALDNRKVLFAVTEQFDFRCSYLLSAKSLDGVSKEIKGEFPKYGKRNGDLDYKKIRHSETELTEAEKGYCEMDTLTVNAYILTQMKLYGDIAKIPYTNTGRVRRLCRDKCFSQKNYRPFIHDLNVSPEEFKACRIAFQGGYVHANPLYTACEVDDVASFDFTSSYPYVMLSEKYPMSSALVYPKAKITERVFERYCENHLAIVAITLEKIRVKESLMPILSSSKCFGIKKGQFDNGKVWSADSLKTVVTSIEYFNLKKFYDIGKITLGQAWFYKADYLPKPYIETILDLYEAKTKLKDLKGKDEAETLDIEREYMLKKNMLNSLYGMMVFNPIKDEYYFDGEWKTNARKIDENTTYDMNSDKSRFTFYLWGVFVTTYARNNLYTALLEAKNDFVYSDTDSVKIINHEAHKEYFHNYDVEVVEKLRNMCERVGIDFARCKPKNVKGAEKLLGIWDFEGVYSRFKTLGAKRYLTEKKGEIDLTVSGVNKRKALPYLFKKHKDNDGVFRAFNDNMYLPKNATGKSIHSYIDDEIGAYVTDYMGKRKWVVSKSGVHLIESDYSLSLLQVYADFIKYIQVRGV